MEYGSILMGERKKQGLSRKELAMKAGVTERAVDYWENGKRHMTLDSACRVFKALNMSITIGAPADSI